jgi:hypothetical protein
MTPERLRRVEELYHLVRERSPEGQVELLEQCDVELRREVESLLDQQDCGLLDRPAIEAAADLLDVSQLQTGHLPVGTNLGGRFCIVRFIAAGGMGDVYEAEDLELHEPVAVKTIRSEYISDRRLLSRFKREIQYAKKVTHPPMCAVFTIWECTGMERLRSFS